MAEVETLWGPHCYLNSWKDCLLWYSFRTDRQVGKKIFHPFKDPGRREIFWKLDTIEDTLISLLEECKQKHIQILDIKVDRGTLEQHFIEMAWRIGMNGFLYSLALQWKLDIRSKSLLVTTLYRFIFFLLMGGIFYFRYT